jgi:hypothetical protein
MRCFGVYLCSENKMKNNLANVTQGERAFYFYLKSHKRARLLKKNAL